MLTIDSFYLLQISYILFLISLLNIILNRKNILMILISIELMLLSLNINFTTFSIYFDDLYGHIAVLLILTIAASESSVGLAILVLIFKLKNSIQIQPIKKKLILKT